MKRPYYMSVLIALDELANAILGGWSGETISSRSYRLWKERDIAFPMQFINFIMCNKSHCLEAYEVEVHHDYLPKEER